MSAIALAASAGASDALAATPFMRPPGDVNIRLVAGSGGALVPGTVARVTIMDGFVRGQSTEIHTVRPDGAGWVRVDFPYDDRYVKAHPAQRRFNVEVSVAVPSGDSLRTVTATGFVFDRVARREATISPANGTTLAVPALPALPAGRAAGSSATDAPSNPADCANDFDMYEYFCSRVTYPSNMTQVPVVLAHNAGAGYDTMLELTYDQAGRIQTTTAADFGLGVVEVGSSQSVSNSDRTTVRFGGGSVRYGNPNEWASVLTQWSQTQRYHCKKPDWPFNGTTHCEPDGVSWAPVGVSGSSQTTNPNPDEPLWHDRLSSCVVAGRCPKPDEVCVEEFYDGYTRGHGTQIEREYRAKVNVGGTLVGVDLHASTEYTRADNTSTTVTYAYRAVSPAAMKHVLFTHSVGAYDPTRVGGGVCPSVNIGEAWTATNHTFTAPGPHAFYALGDQASLTTGDPRPGRTYRKVGRCAYVPDDCRSGMTAG